MSLLERLTQGAASRPAAGSLREFLEAEVAADKGPFTLAGRAALAEPIDLIDRIISGGVRDATVTILKGTQIGFSTLAAGLAIYLCAVRRLSVGFFLPDDGLADQMSDNRIRTTLRNPKLTETMRDAEYRGTRSKGMKEFPGPDGSRFLYVKGLHDIGNATSIPLDVALNDEVDDIPPNNLKWSKDRLDASLLALTVNLGAGRTPGKGIHARYLGGSQRVWRVPCPGCGEEWVLEESWEAEEGRLGIIREEGGRAFLACPACAHPLDPEAGRFVPGFPEAEEERRHWSFRIPQLAVSAIRPERVLAKWREAKTPKDRSMFRCSSLAMPDAGDLQPITAELLRRLREAEPYHMEVVS